NLTSMGNLTAGGYIDLENCRNLTSMGNLTAGGYIDLENCRNLTSVGNLTAGRDINLENCRNLTSVGNLTAGRYIDLENCRNLTSAGNLTAGESIDLQNCALALADDLKATPLPRNFQKELNYYLSTHSSCPSGKYRIIDGIFCEVVEQRNTHMKVLIDGEPVVIVEKEKYFAHGNTYAEAKKAVIEKIALKDTSLYEQWRLNTEITVDQAKLSYRAITGACEFGVKRFMESVEIPNLITPAVVIEATRGRYGHEEYKSFFQKPTP
ncbi:MAG: hypothetical protein FWF24_04740, partial [Alphaproteobacteria bacterium]|nr:hypothetical protein [Alphaproteobacteria bacterium]